MFTTTKRLKRSTLGPVTAFAAALMLAACGSGGGSSSPTPTPTDPTTLVTPTDPTVKTSVEGYWGGPTNIPDPANSNNFFAMAGPVLENGEYWFVRSLNGVIDSLVHGKGLSADSKFNSTDAKFWGTNQQTTVVPGTLASTSAYVVNSTFPGSVIWKSGTDTFGWSFRLAYDSTLSYDNPATIAYVVGNWVGQWQTISTLPKFNFVVTSTGSATPVLTMTFTQDSPLPGCVWTGTIAPRLSGKNIYDVVMTIGQQASCTVPGTVLVPGAVFSGIATPGVNASTGKPRLVLTAIDSSNTYDFIGLIDVAP